MQVLKWIPSYGDHEAFSLLTTPLVTATSWTTYLHTIQWNQIYMFDLACTYLTGVLIKKLREMKEYLKGIATMCLAASNNNNKIQPLVKQLMKFILYNWQVRSKAGFCHTIAGVKSLTIWVLSACMFWRTWHELHLIPISPLWLLSGPSELYDSLFTLNRREWDLPQVWN